MKKRANRSHATLPLMGKRWSVTTGAFCVYDHDHTKAKTSKDREGGPSEGAQGGSGRLYDYPYDCCDDIPQISKQWPNKPC